MAKKLTAKDLDALSSEYSAPEPREKPDKVASFETQEEAAQFVKDMMKMAAHGAVGGFGEELLAGAQTGSFTSPEYKAKRGEYRQELGRIREESPFMAPLAEAAGAIASTEAAPILKGFPVVKQVLSAAIGGAGEAPEISDIPKEAAKSAGIQLAMEGIGKGVKKLIADDSTKILSKSMGVKSAQANLPEGRAVQDSVRRLNNAGFFKQGEVVVDSAKQKFRRIGTNLDTFLKPQTLDSLYERANNSLSLLKEANNKLVAGKKIKEKDFFNALQSGIEEMGYDPHGFDIPARIELVQDTANKILGDLKIRGEYVPGHPITAKAVEEAKKALDLHVGTPAFKKRAEELNLNPESIMLFRQKLDELVDKVGGPAYKKNNDLMSDLISVRNTIENKLNKEYVDTGTGIVDKRGLVDKLLETVSPTPVDILRSDLATAAETPMGQITGKVLKRGVTEKVTGRMPQSIGMSPMEIAKIKLPRTTQGLLQNKELTLAKMAQAGLPPQDIDMMSQAMNDTPSAFSSAVALMMPKLSGIFEDSKYQMFDGKILDPNERARAADETAKREDLDSLQRAKIINELNKTGRYIGD